VRLSGVVQARYTYNGRGERVKKEAGDEGVYFHYDLNGRLLAETEAEGQTLKEYLYLEGMPLAMVAMQTTKPNVYSLQGQDPSNGQAFRLTPGAPNPHPKPRRLKGWGWHLPHRPRRETPDVLLAAHATPERRAA